MMTFLISVFLVLVNFGIFADCAYCDFDKIPFPGLKREKNRLYLHGESFNPACQTGYTVTKPGGKLMCSNGVWSGHFPPCVAANCLGAPPTIQNGKAVSFTGVHSTTANYVCDEFYFFAKEYSVQCLQGEWLGVVPVCKDSRCRFNDLKKKDGIMFINNSTTLSGENLELVCSKGYKPIGVTPICTRGVWVEFGTSPCKPMECVVAEIHHGALMEAEERRSWRWANLRRESKTVYKKVKKGVSKQSGEILQLVCKSKYSFEGKGQSNVTVTCEKGQWIPKPVCESAK